MNRDNFLYLFCGAVLGLISGTIFLGPMVADVRRGAAATRGEAVAQTQLQQPASAGTAHPEQAGDAAVMQRVLEEIETLKSRLSQNPQDVDAMVRLGNLYMDAHKFEDAIGYFENALTHGPDPDVKTDLGLCYRGRGDVDGALRTFREVRAAHPEHFAARFNEAVVLFVDLKRADEARVIVEQLKKERPQDPAVAKFEQALAAGA